MIDRASSLVNVLACIVLFLMMLVSVVDVVGRNLFQYPIPGSSELIEFAMVATVFLIYPRVAYRGTHISIDLFDRFMNETAQRVQFLVGNVLGAFLFGAIAWRLRVLADRAAEYNDVTGYLEMPISVIFWFMTIMSAVTALAFVAKVPAAFRRGPFSLAPSNQEHN